MRRETWFTNFLGTYPERDQLDNVIPIWIDRNRTRVSFTEKEAFLPISGYVISSVHMWRLCLIFLAHVSEPLISGFVSLPFCCIVRTLLWPFDTDWPSRFLSPVLQSIFWKIWIRCFALSHNYEKFALGVTFGLYRCTPLYICDSGLLRSQMWGAKKQTNARNIQSLALSRRVLQRKYYLLVVRAHKD